MRDDFLAIGVRDPREQVPEDGIGLHVNFVLRLGNGFGLAGLREGGCLRADAITLEFLPGFFDDGLPEVVAEAMHVVIEVGGVLAVLYLCVSSLVRLVSWAGAAVTAVTYGDDEDHGALLSRQFLAFRGQLGESGGDELETSRRLLAGDDLFLMSTVPGLCDCETTSNSSFFFFSTLSTASKYDLCLILAGSLRAFNCDQTRKSCCCALRNLLWWS